MVAVNFGHQKGSTATRCNRPILPFYMVLPCCTHISMAPKLEADHIDLFYSQDDLRRCPLRLELKEIPNPLGLKDAIGDKTRVANFDQTLLWRPGFGTSKNPLSERLQNGSIQTSSCNGPDHSSQLNTFQLPRRGRCTPFQKLPGTPMVKSDMSD